MDYYYSEWLFATQMALASLAFIAYGTQVVRLKYQPKLRTNRLSYVPFFFVMIYLALYIVRVLLYFYLRPDPNALYFDIVNSSSAMVCFFWTSIFLCQCFEWNLQALLIYFQCKVPLDQMGVQRQRFFKREKMLTALYACIFLAFLGTHGWQFVLPYRNLTD